MIAGLFTIILILIFIALLINSKAFRWAVVVLVGVCILGVVVLLIVLEENQKSSAREQDTARHRMTANEIELSDMQLQIQGGHLQGRLHNKSSRFVVSEVGLHVTVEDCDASGCEKVGQEDVRISKSTPPGQARDFSEYVFFSSSPNARRGKLQWHYEVAYVEANPPSKE